MEDIVRALRIIEYVGPRDKVEKQIARSIATGPIDYGNGVTIRAATIGQYPEILLHHTAAELAAAKLQQDALDAARER